MLRPSGAVAEALAEAARQTLVPVTLLAAVAYQESTYRVDAVGQPTKGGWRAMGLMQLSPDVMRAYGVSETQALQPMPNAVAGARYLAALSRSIPGGDWSDVLAAYHWGLSNVRRYRRLKRRFIAPVRLYVESVLDGRRWLQNQVKPVGSTAYERVTNAIEGLASANPAALEITKLRDSFREYAASFIGKIVHDVALLEVGPLRAYWEEYARLYDSAPITDDSTPRPEAIEPSLWSELLRRRVEDGDQQTLPAGGAPVENVALARRSTDAIVLPAAGEDEPPTISVGAAIALGALLYLLFSAR